MERAKLRVSDTGVEAALRKGKKPSWQRLIWTLKETSAQTGTVNKVIDRVKTL